MKNKIAVLLGLLCLWAGTAQAQKVIRLYPGAAPGSGNWTQQEREMTRPPLVTNVVNPTLTMYAPDPAVANGTSVIICPGGAFHFLVITYEGVEVAKWLAARGVTAFILRYRLVPTGDDPTKELRDKMKDHKKFDDDLVPGSVQLYNQWLAAKKPVEIHLYAKGGHGFGVRKQNLPTDQWIDRFGDWLQMQGFLRK